MQTFTLVRRLKFILILSLIGFFSKANIPSIPYFFGNNIKTTFSKINSKQSINIDFLYEEVEEEEEHQKEDHREKGSSNKLFSSFTFSLRCNAAIPSQRKGILKYVFSKNPTGNPLYVRFANFRI